MARKATDVAIGTILSKKQSALTINCGFRNVLSMDSPEPNPANPADRVIAAFGGVQKLAKAIGRDPSRVHRWRYPVEKGGTGGRIPGSAVPSILAAAARENIGLTANDLFAPPVTEAAA